MPKLDEGKFNWFLWLIGASCFIAIASSFYSFYFKKDYTFVVEVACDTNKEECFQRDCTNPDDCPPNQLSIFKRYNLRAYDFAKCENEDCANVCENNIIKCEKVACVKNEEVGEACSKPESAVTNE
jgi:hypothetical protein